MNKLMIICGAIVIASSILASCGEKKASDYEELTKEYKEVLCIAVGGTDASLSEKSKALQKQMDLNVKYEEALKSLSQDEKSKLMLSWANAMLEASAGQCD